MYLFQRTSNRRISKLNALRFVDRVKREFKVLESNGPLSNGPEMVGVLLALNRLEFRLQVDKEKNDE